MSFWGGTKKKSPGICDTLRMPLFSQRRYRQGGGLKKREDEKINRNDVY